MPRKNKHAVALGRQGGRKTMAERPKAERIRLARLAARVSALRRARKIA